MTTAASSNATYLENYRRFRFFKDKVTTVSVTAGGLGIIVTLLLIFAYLLYEVLPLFQGASIESVSHYDLPLALSSDNTLLVAMEEQAEIAFRLTDKGDAVFWHARTGKLVSQQKLMLPADSHITSFAQSSAESRLFIVGLSSGQAVIAKHHYRISYPNDKRLITPEIQYPYGNTPIDISSGAEINSIAYRDGEESLTIAAMTGEQKLKLIRLQKEEDFLSEEMTLKKEEIDIHIPGAPIDYLGIDIDQRWLFMVENGTQLSAIDITGDAAAIVDTVSLPEASVKFNALSFLLGGISLLSADTSGLITQWFMVRDQDANWRLQSIRQFQQAAGERVILQSEQRRKGFISLHKDATLSLYHSTAQRELLTKKVSDKPISDMALSPRADALLLIDEQQAVSYWRVDNEHPDVSWQVLWQEVWYESYQKPEYIWQSSSSSNDFEPKFSLTPLAFGTLKAAFYTMLFAAPLAICGAIYTAYFMAGAMRRKVKPLIELMEALPTVILGFLAGIWLAPFIESSLSAVFALAFAIPLTIFLTGYLWHISPKKIHYLLPPGYEAALLIPSVLLVGWFCIEFNAELERVFFGGDMRSWITRDLGISFDQRNALVVGIAMGLAVIPTIFSITEDAIFSVPKHLSNASLALGASPWQTLVGVVLPTASPGIFSALMIGMGRAVGETMIVLMATGNTPIMDANIFEGLRSLSANIAVEVPEAAVDSTHFRVLYLSAFFLFLFTFIVNTIAEIVRQRLRRRYGSL